jgi:hypothetical protein
MEVWDWVHDYQAQALSSDDTERLRLTLIQSEAAAVSETDPDQALALLDKEIRLAKHLREPWWILFFEFWRTETLLFDKLDYNHLLDQAVRTVLEVRKPIYDQHPLRFAILGHLAPNGFSGSDG